MIKCFSCDKFFDDIHIKVLCAENKSIKVCIYCHQEYKYEFNSSYIAKNLSSTAEPLKSDSEIMMDFLNHIYQRVDSMRRYERAEKIDKVLND